MLRTIELENALFQGAVSLEPVEGGIKPWRIPYKDYVLYPPNGINKTSEISAGVRLRFATDSTVIRIELAPVQTAVELDLVIDGTIVQTCKLAQGDSLAVFEGLPAQDKVVEAYLPQKTATIVKTVAIEAGADCRIPGDTRPKWISYGSSITQCNGAFSPAQTWPAIVARRFGLHLTSLGFSGNCHLEPMVARLIRDLDADIISLCLGINVYGGSTLNSRTFQAAVIGFVQLIREKHPDKPIAVMSPIWSPPRENTKNTAGFTLCEMREQIVEAIGFMASLGDERLHYVDGTTIFDDSLAEHLPDQLHPNGQGYAIMGANYGTTVMEPLLARYGLLRGQAAVTSGQ